MTQTRNQDPTSRRFTDERRDVDTVIGSRVRAEGTIEGRTNVDIAGAFDGTITIEGLAWLKPGGVLTATIEATDIVLEGEAKGTFTASNKIDLRRTAKVEGEITARTIAIADGSHFEGGITMAGETEPQVTRYEEKRSVKGTSD